MTIMKNKTPIPAYDRLHFIACPLWLLLILFSVVGCVPTKKYDLLLASKDALQKEYSALQDARRERTQMADSLVRVNAKLSETQAESEDWKNRYISYYHQLEDLNKELASLRTQNAALEETARTTNEDARKAVSERLKELDARERELRLSETALKSTQGTVVNLKKELDNNDQETKNLGDAFRLKEAEMHEIQQKIAQILRGFNTNELTVRDENGRVYVILSENLLFEKGKSDVKTRGEDALKKIASALNASSDVDIEVEGHTDSDGSEDANWQLSAARAISVSKILIKDKVNAGKITASGRSSHRPIVPNNTEINKIRNRRTEIILSPHLDELYDLVKKKQ